MTPLDRLGTMPAFYVLVHEAGHVLFGLTLGIVEGSIQFVEGPTDEVAKSHFSTRGVNPMNLLVRSLAGMVCQAALSPESVTDDLRPLITTCGLFSTNEVFADTDMASLMRLNGFIGDWDRICAQSSQAFGEGPERIRACQQSHEQTVAMADDRQLQLVLREIVDDICVWARTDDEDVPFWPEVHYPAWRARDIAARATKNSGG